MKYNKPCKKVQSNHAMTETEDAVLQVMQEVAVLSCNAEGALEQRSYIIKVQFYYAAG
jgi:hypothetical protein